MNFLFYVPQMAAYGGMERHVCTLAAALAEKGHLVRLLTTSNSLGPDLRRELAHPLISLRELPQPRGSAGALRKIIWLLAELRHNIARPWDVIYTNGQSALARLAWRAAGPGTRIVHHHHTAADAGEQATWSRSYRQVLVLADQLVGCSQATCAALDAATARTDAIFLPYLTTCPLRTDEIIERPPGPRLRFGFCGRLIPEKGIEVILDLAADPSLADLEWHIHGSGAAYPPASFAGRPRLHYHGAYQSGPDQAQALLALDALVLFSTHNEGMPLSLIEGMAAGLPWIATDRGGTRELALSPPDCLVLPGSSTPAEIRDGVRTLSARLRAGSTSRRRQRAGYDATFAPPVAAGRWLEYFHHIVHPGPSP
jgi:glycosyltransferase involved in cell wall biosynthesis